MSNAPRIPRGTIDFETRSFLGVRNVGAWKYAEHESTEILCMSTRLPRTEPNLWIPGLEIPGGLIRYIESNGLFEAHNAQFERAVWLRIMLEKMGYPMPKRWMDTMAVCAYKALPLGLDAVGDVLNLNIKKDKRGKYLLDKLSKPRKPTKKDPRIWVDDFDLYEELYDYCDRDTASEEDLSITLGDLPPSEYKLWVLDQKINQRGVYLDMEAVNAAKVVCQQIEKKWNAELAEVTGDVVTKGTQVARIKDWCATQGVVMGSLGKDILNDMLNDEKKKSFLPPQVKRALEIRLELGMASTAKINKFLETVCNDGKVRGMLQYHGAGTGRWAGRGAQPQNFPRGITKPKDYVHHLLGTTSDIYGTIPSGKDGYDAARSEELLADIKLMDSGYLSIKYGTAMGAVSSSLRGMMTASPGNRLMVADFSAIEAVVLAWVCGEESKLDVFRNKLDPYCETASGIFGFKVNKKIAKDPSHPDYKKHADARQTGKTCLAGDISVITNNGVKQLLSVTKDDMLWDGASWVNHDGIVDNGVKETIALCGARMTEDHLLLTNGGWQEAKMAASSENILRSALEIGLESLSLLKRPAALDTYANVHAAHLRIRSIPATSIKGNLPGALRAAGLQQQSGERIFGRMLTFAQMIQRGECSLTGYLRSCKDVIIQKTKHTRTTADVGYEFTGHGAKTAGLSSNTLLSFQDTTIRRLSLTEKITTKAISLATSGSALAKKICSTNAASRKCNHGSSNLKLRMRVYDLVNAGPNNRFTILTNRGPMVVHNCELAFGYQGGVGAWRNFDRTDSKTDDEINETKDTWRSNHPNIQDAWYGFERAALNAVSTGKPHHYNGITFGTMTDKAGNWMYIQLPNGRKLWYYDPMLHDDVTPWGKPCKKLTYQGKDNNRGGAWGRVETYGGKLTENIVQAIARDLMVEGMIQVEILGYLIILTVHDEIIADVPFGFGSQEEFEKAMAYVPPWATGCPVAVDGWTGHRYRK